MLRTLVFLTASGMIALASAQETVRLTGLPPGKVTYKSISEMTHVPDAKLMIADRQQRMTKKTATGVEYAVYDDVPKEAAEMISYERKRMTRAKGNEKVEVAADLSKSRFAALKLAAYSTDGQHAKRVFEDKDGTEVLLREWNFARDGGSVLIIKDFCNTEVLSDHAPAGTKGTPATFVAMRHGNSGKVQWRLGWATDERNFDLIMVGDESADRAFDYLMKLARSL